MADKKKGGRPEKEVIQDAWISCRLNIKEKENIKKTAKENNITVSEFIYRAITNKKIIANKPELFREFIKVNTELYKIGNNINQIAKQINTMVKVGALDPSISKVVLENLQKHNDNLELVKKEMRNINRNIASK